MLKALGTTWEVVKRVYPLFKDRRGHGIVWTVWIHSELSQDLILLFLEAGAGALGCQEIAR